MAQARKERQHDRNDEEDNDDPLQKFHPSVGKLVGNFPVDAVQGLKFSNDRCIPFCEVKSFGGEPVESREVLIANELENVVNTFKQHGAVHLPLCNAMELAGA